MDLRGFVRAVFLPGVVSKGPEGVYLCSTDGLNLVPGPSGRYLFDKDTGPMGRMKFALAFLQRYRPSGPFATTP